MVDLSEEELMQFKRVSGVYKQQASDENILTPDIPCAEDGCERVGR